MSHPPPPVGPDQLIFAELRRAVSAGPERWLLIASAVVGALTAVLVSFPLGEALTFSAASYYVQSAISLPLPWVSIVMMRDLSRRTASTSTFPPFGRLVAAKQLASAVIAILGASYGIALSSLVTSLPAATLSDAQWAGFGSVVIGSILVQLIAQLCGAGFGLLIMSTEVAIVADVVVPLGLWLLTGRSPALHGVQAWVTPFASVDRLLSGEMDARGWAQVVVVVLIWVVGLNVAGVVRRRRLADQTRR
jgi:hypothetical protein